MPEKCALTSIRGGFSDGIRELISKRPKKCCFSLQFFSNAGRRFQKKLMKRVVSEDKKAGRLPMRDALVLPDQTRS